MTSKKLELLAPAKDLLTGMAAVNHGADAVYIGARQFSARSAAANSIKEIEKLASHAHVYHARVYAALNTILFDRELEDARQLIHELWGAGVDALIIQDMGILEMDLPPMPLFASTQCDNRTWEKVKFLEDTGFDRVILARELGIEEISTIREKTSVDLEAFVHGALCVGYSGQCYLSAAIGNRSANRGGCGQPCRLPWTLTGRTGRALEKESHLLSLKDMNRSAYLESLVQAGITSFKIEGRLKDVAYVKNITAFYRQRIDELLEGRAGSKQAFQSASSGKTRIFFAPDPEKTFHRGQTDYLLFGSGPDQKGQIHAFFTPKSMGEKLGEATRVESGFFTLSGTGDVVSGDGLCFKDRDGTLAGFYVEKSDHGRIMPSGRAGNLKKRLTPGTAIFRNHDHRFLKQLSGTSAERKIGLEMRFHESRDGFVLEGRDEDGICARVVLPVEKISAKNESAARAAVEKQLGKLGSTLFYLNRLEICSGAWFLPVKALNQARRDLVEALMNARQKQDIRNFSKHERRVVPYPDKKLAFTANVANGLAVQFYQKRGVVQLEPAFELEANEPSVKEKPVMVSRHCLQNALGRCPKAGGSTSPGFGNDPVFLENRLGRFELRFNCARCEMEIWRLPG